MLPRLGHGRLAVVLAFVAVIALSAQSSTKFAARLSRAAIDTAELSRVSGIGSAKAELKGTTLTITGTFSGLLSAATKAHLDRGIAKGVRGRQVFDLKVSPATDGTVSGTITLSPSQVDDLRVGRLYLQIDSEQAPNGNLWGWLLPEDTRP
jgi:hypothetical protein